MKASLPAIWQSAAFLEKISHLYIPRYDLIDSLFCSTDALWGAAATEFSP